MMLTKTKPTILPLNIPQAAPVFWTFPAIDKTFGIRLKYSILNKKDEEYSNQQFYKSYSFYPSGSNKDYYKLNSFNFFI